MLGAAGTLDINAYNGSLAPGTYKLITIPGGTIVNTANAASWSIGSNNDVAGHTYSFSAATPGEFDLIVTGTTSLVWTGHTSGTGAADDVWDTARMNWAMGASPAAFTTGAAVTFGDTNPIAGGSAPDGMVTVQAGGVAPSAVVFNNSAVSYTLTNASGTIGITGSASLSKSGAGTRHARRRQHVYRRHDDHRRHARDNRRRQHRQRPARRERPSRSQLGSEPCQQPNGEQPVGHGRANRLGVAQHRRGSVADRQSIDEHNIRRDAR